MNIAERMAEIQESHIDDALLALSRALDGFRRANNSHSANLIDDAIASTQAAFRECAQ